MGRRVERKAKARKDGNRHFGRDDFHLGNVNVVCNRRRVMSDLANGTMLFCSEILMGMKRLHADEE